MVYKACIYKGCDNYTYDYVPCGSKKFTIFRFPKDPRRYELWMKLGRVPDGLPESQMLMCSEHFDNKYLIKNQRRTSLISTAIPFPYFETSNDINDNIGKECEEATDKVDDALDTEMVFSIQDLNDESALIRLKENECEDDVDCGMLDYGKVDNQSETEYCVESTTMKDTGEHLADLLEDYEGGSDLEEKIFTEVVTQSRDIAKSNKTNVKKRKLNSDIDDNQEPTSSKALVTKITAQVKNENAKQENEEYNKNMRQKSRNPSIAEPDARQIDAETLVDTKAVTCFIFKGEEYVQMPKEYYVQEKLELIEKLKRYEYALCTFKQNLLELDLP